MKYKLILLKDGRNILVSDESYIKGDYTIDLLDDCLIEQVEVEKGDCCSFEFKIIGGIGGLPTINYSDEVKQVLRDKYGYFTKDYIEHLAVEFEKESGNSYNQEFEFYEAGFKKHQSLTNKMFSLEDMVKIYKEGYTDCLHNKGEYKTDYLINKLQQPIQLDIEVEIEEVGGDNLENSNKKQIYYNRPKITNNSILITKILE